MLGSRLAAVECDAAPGGKPQRKEPVQRNRYEGDVGPYEAWPAAHESDERERARAPQTCQLEDASNEPAPPAANAPLNEEQENGCYEEGRIEPTRFCIAGAVGVPESEQVIVSKGKDEARGYRRCRYESSYDERLEQRLSSPVLPNVSELSCTRKR